MEGFVCESERECVYVDRIEYRQNYSTQKKKIERKVDTARVQAICVLSAIHLSFYHYYFLGFFFPVLLLLLLLLCLSYPLSLLPI